MRVLSRLGWPGEIREAFLSSGGDRLPSPEYEPFDATDTLAAIDQVRRLLEPGSTVDDWFGRECDAIESTARMLAAVGTAEVFDHSGALYGTPTRPLRYDPTTPLELAERVHEVIGRLREVAPDPSAGPRSHERSDRRGAAAGSGRALR